MGLVVAWPGRHAVQQIVPVVVGRIQRDQFFQRHDVGGVVLQLGRRAVQQAQFFLRRRLACLFAFGDRRQQFVPGDREIIVQVVAADQVRTRFFGRRAFLLVALEPLDRFRIVLCVVVVIAQAENCFGLDLCRQAARRDQRLECGHRHRIVAGGLAEPELGGVQHIGLVGRLGGDCVSLGDTVLDFGVVLLRHQLLDRVRVEQLEQFRTDGFHRCGRRCGRRRGLLRVRARHQCGRCVQADSGQHQADAGEAELGHGKPFIQRQKSERMLSKTHERRDPCTCHLGDAAQARIVPLNQTMSLFHSANVRDSSIRKCRAAGLQAGFRSPEQGSGRALPACRPASH